MFAKLLKHEFRTSKSILGLLSLIALGVSVLATAATKLLVCNIQNLDKASESALAVAAPVLGFSVLGLVVYMGATFFLLLAQFYKSKFTDEGYLTFTLPTGSHMIYLASVVNILIWHLIAGVVVFCGVMMVLLFGTSPDHVVNTELFTAWRENMEYLFSVLRVQFDWVEALSGLTRGLISAISGVVLTTTCITIGAAAAKKHKILAAVGIYYGLSLLISIVSSAFLAANSAVILAGQLDYTGTVSTLLNLAIAVGGYFLTTWLMKKRINLP